MNGPHEPAFPFSACLLFGCLAVIGGLVVVAFILAAIAIFAQ